jgi:hypothetical protein
LTNPFAGDLELAANFLKSTGVAILKSEALLENFALPLG